MLLKYMEFMHTVRHTNQFTSFETHRTHTVYYAFLNMQNTFLVSCVLLLPGPH